MKVGIQARLKNGILWEAALKLGSQKALADHLGVHQMYMNDWINFKRSPDFIAHPDRWSEVESKLLQLTGHTLDEIFPPEIRSAEFQKRQRRIDAIVEMPIERLMEAGLVPKQLTAPDNLLFAREQSDVIAHVLGTLKPREAEVIKMRFGLDGYSEHTLDDLVPKFKVTRERIRQIEIKALNKLRERGPRCHQLKRVNYYELPSEVSAV